MTARTFGFTRVSALASLAFLAAPPVAPAQPKSAVEATIEDVVPAPGLFGEESFSRTILGPTASCGFVETTWGDPEWVVATSDHILRATDCLAECAPGAEEFWYDRVISQPCYPDTRLWKLAPDAEAVSAFPMGILGTGTFDGLYVRDGFTFRIYQDCENPFFAEMTGPRYITIDHWRDVNPACEGFEPGTLFVTGGPGALSDYSIIVTLTARDDEESGAVSELVIMEPDTTTWSPDTELQEKDVVFTEESLKAKLTLTGKYATVSEFTCPVEARVFNHTLDAEEWVAITLNDDDVLANDGCELRITVTVQELRQLGLLPNNPADAIEEYGSADKNHQVTGRSTRFDSDWFEIKAKVGRVLRGSARGPGNLAAALPESAFSKEFLQAAGVRWVEVRSAGKKSEKRQLQDQADWFYISSHGNHSNAKISNDAGNETLVPTEAKWNEDLDVVFFAGCSVLDINDYNGNYTGSAHAASPGENWVTTGPTVFLGYNWVAPLDNNVGNQFFTTHIVTKFFKNYGLTQPFQQAWSNANRDMATTTNHKRPGGRPYNCCVIDLSPPGTNDDQYWYFDVTTSPPTWTMKLRATW